MYVSDNLMKEALKEALGEYLEAGYIRRQGYVDEELSLLILPYQMPSIYQS